VSSHLDGEVPLSPACFQPSPNDATKPRIEGVRLSARKYRRAWAMNAPSLGWSVSTAAIGSMSWGLWRWMCLINSVLAFAGPVTSIALAVPIALITS